MSGYDDYNDEPETFDQQRARVQNELVSALLERLESRYLTREKMYRKILTNKRNKFSLKGTIDRIDLIDSVRENVKTSLTFGNYRRAAWYLKILERLCKTLL